MKARVLFGVFGFAFVLLALYVFPPIVLELVVAALCVFATYEVLGSTKLVRNHLELLLAMAVSLGLAVGHFSILPLRLESVMQGLVLVLLFGSFAIELKYHDVMKASQVSWAFFGGLVAVSYTHLDVYKRQGTISRGFCAKVRARTRTSSRNDKNSGLHNSAL